MSPTEAMFLLAETSSHPLHLGALELFVPPPGAGPDHARVMFEDLISHEDVSERFRRRPTRAIGVGYPWWSHEDNVDLGYHVRHTAVPRPGRMGDLLALTSQMHGMPLDNQRPMWEMQVIEGLDDGRIAVYSKIHRSLADSASGLRLLHRALSADPDARDCPAPWSPDTGTQSRHVPVSPGELIRAGARAAADVLGMAPATAKIAYQGLREQYLTLPLQAPPTMFNVPIGRARKLAAQSWPIDRLATIATTVGTTISNVVLAMCAGALRSYLLGQYALPDAPLTALLPVPLDLGGPANEPAGGDNGFGAIVVGLATDEPDAAKRLARICESVDHTHRAFSALSDTQFQLLSALSISPLALAPVSRFVDLTRPPFNVVIAYFPGPPTPGFWNGARLDAVYPASLVLGGQALGIALTSTGDRLDVGVVGDRHAVPHLQRILTHLETSLADLEASTDRGVLN